MDTSARRPGTAAWDVCAAGRCFRPAGRCFRPARRRLPWLKTGPCEEGGTGRTVLGRKGGGGIPAASAGARPLVQDGRWRWRIPRPLIPVAPCCVTRSRDIYALMQLRQMLFRMRCV